MMTAPSVPDLAREALDALSPQQLFRHTSWARHQGETDPNLIASAVTRDLNYNKHGLVSLICSLKDCRDAGLKLPSLSTELQESLVSLLSAASILSFERSSVGIAISRNVDDVSLVVTSPLMRNWEFLTRNSVYFPLIFLADGPQEQHRSILERIHGQPFSWTKDFHDDYNRLVKDIIHIWALMFNHWASIKTEEKTEPSTNNDTKVDDGADMTIEMESDNVTQLPIRPTRRFAGVYPPRRYKRHSLPPALDHGPAIRSRPTHVKSRVKSEEAIVGLDIEKEDKIRKNSQHPNSIPPSIKARLDRIPRLQNLPDISSPDIYHLLERKKASRAAAADKGHQRRDNKMKKKQAREYRVQECFLLPEWNPYAPRTPCAPGLMFGSPESSNQHRYLSESLINNEPTPRPVFIRVSNRPQKWLYLGEYRFQPAPPLSEWHEMSLELRKQWKTESMKDTEEEKIKWRRQWRDLNSLTKMLSVFTMECIAYRIQTATTQL